MPKKPTARAFWLARLKFFVEHHPDFPVDEEIYVPRNHLRIGLYIEGDIHIVGDDSTLQINFNDPALIVICHTKAATEHIYRFPWSRLIGFELIPTRAAPEPNRRGYFLN